MEKDNSSQTDLSTIKANSKFPTDPDRTSYPQEEHSFDFIFSFDSEFNQSIPNQRSSPPSLSHYNFSTPNKPISSSVAAENFLFTESVFVNPSQSRETSKKVDSLEPQNQDLFHPEIYPSRNEVQGPPSPISHLKGDRFQVPQRDPGPGTLNNHSESRGQFLLDLSKDPFGSPPSVLGEQLLESPGETPAQFYQAKLRIDQTILSDSEVSVISETQSKEDTHSSIVKKGEPYDTTNQKLIKSLRRLSFEEVTSPPGKQIEASFGKEDVNSSSNIHPLKEPDPDLSEKRITSKSEKMELNEAYSSSFQMLSMDGNMAVHPDIDELSYPLANSSAPDVVRSPSTTEEALALQRAVIGNSSASPASMDEINATIAAVQKQYRERLDNLGDERSSLLEKVSLSEEKKNLHASTSSLDETPTKLPASQDVLPPEGTFHATDNHTEQGKNTPTPVTISKKPSSLMAQNTTLALETAVSGKFNKSPTVGPGIGSGPYTSIIHGRVLHRNPIEGVTTHRGGRTVVAPKDSDIVQEKIQSEVIGDQGAGDHPKSHSDSLPNGVTDSTQNNTAQVPEHTSALQSETSSVKPPSTNGELSSMSDSPDSGVEPVKHQTESHASSQTPPAPVKPLPPLFPVRRKDINRMPSTSITQTLKARSGSSGDSDVMQLLREKANLEGQIETLIADTEAALQSRAELQAQVAGLQAQLKAQKYALEQATQEKLTSEGYMQNLRANRNDLEDKLLALQNNLEMKDNNLEDVKKELEGTQEANSKLAKRLDDVKRDVASKEMNIAKLREKVAVLENKLENSIDSGSQSSADVRTLQADLLSAQKTKDWFQDQLHHAQEDRNKLQRELSAAQEKSRSDTLSIELLKTENSQMKQQLNETRQQSLLEKEQIAKHLETIEADILAREATFAEIQREKLAVHDAVLAQMNEVEMEKHKVANLVASAVELERQLEATQKELADKKNRLFEVEAEKKELVKDLTLAQESLSSKERELESAEIKNKDIEARLNEKKSRSENQDDELARLRADKTSLEAALIAANEEKRSFDNALQNLRGDMEKVEKSYRQMAEEVAQKDVQLQELQREQSVTQDRLQGAENQLKEGKQNLDGYASVLERKDAHIKELEQSKDSIQAELDQANKRVEDAEGIASSFQKTQQNLHDQLQTTSDHLNIREQQLQEALAHNANLQGQLETMSEDRNNYAVLLEENKGLKEKLSDTQNAAHRDVAEQKAKMLRLNADLNNLQKELRDKETEHQNEIAQLKQNLLEVENAKVMAEETLQTARSKAADMSKEEQKQMSEALMRAMNDVESLKQEKNRLEAALGEVTRNQEKDNADYQRNVADLEAELEELREILAEMKKNEEDNRKLAIELERERGRLAGVQQSHTALKQHAALLEEALARRESTMTELNEQLSATSQEKVTEEDKLNQLLKEHEEGLRKEKAMSKELRKQLASEKGKNRRTKETLQNKDMELQELQGELEKRASEVESISATVDGLKQAEESYKEQLEASRKEMEGARAQIELLQRYLQDSIAQNPVLEDQMKTLAWECEQKAREVDAMKEQMQLTEKRQKVEMDGLKNSLKMNKQELEALKKELATTRKDKFAFQAKVGQLKAALKATVQQNQLLKAKLRAKKAQLQNNLSSPSNPVDEIVVPEMAYDVESLLASDDIGNLSSGESKPLQALQGCLQSIRSQMGALEKQLGEHQAAVQTSQEAWKEVGDRVRDLRKACASSVPPRQQKEIANPQSQEAEVITSHDTGGTITPDPQSSMTAPNAPGVYDI